MTRSFARRPGLAPDTHLLTALDALAVASVTVLICLASHELSFMSVAVPAIIIMRFMALAAVSPMTMKAETLFFLVCTILGAFNDWNSVCRREIYDYTVPHEWEFSTIPGWMLLFWGMILRLLARFARWKGLDPPPAVSDYIGIGPWMTSSGTAKVAVELALVLVTRQAIYRYYSDPVLSWVPFLAALTVFFIVFGLNRHDWRLLALVAVIGTAVEVLYIQVGHLHRYHLGWIGGVPLWIVLWWCLGALIWKDISFRVERGFRALLVP